MKIQLLSPEVVSQIAAGEVLDRPANLVKELVENSLDARATEIDVEFGGGGRQVLVRDNGFGMVSADLERALLPHATSKINCSEDLYQLQSFGFRGEALASVAAVSQLSIVSRPTGESQGYRLNSNFGVSSSPEAVSTRMGTEIRVRELFANVPARLKFLRSEAAEHGQIKNTLKAMALAHPEVEWNIRSKDTLLYHWPKTSDWLERAKLILETDALFYGEGKSEGIRVEVLVSSPQDAGAVNRNMWFFAQNRWIQDRSLVAAVMEAYRNLLMHGQYPSAVVRLHMSPEDIDVNVHPAKSQVKFRNPQAVFRIVAHTVRSILEKAPWLGEGHHPPALTVDNSVENSVAQNLSFRGGEFDRTQYNKKIFPLSEVRAAVASYYASDERREITSPDPGTVPPGLESTPSLVPPPFRWSDLQVIGQVHLTYIVAQSPEGLYLVDQHAAHERVVFERLMESFKLGKIEVQTLLLPLVIDMPAVEVEALLAAKASLEQMGVSVERMGPESVAVQAIPTLASDAAVVTAVRKLAESLYANVGERGVERMIGDIFASMACHSVVRAGQTLSVVEMEGLLKQMDQFPLSSFCPHGRPVFVKWRFSEIEREFGRIV